MKIIADKKLLLTFAEVFDDRTSKPIEDRSALL